MLNPTPIIPLENKARATNLPKWDPVDDDTGRAKSYNGLTAKQENFCRGVANGKTMTQAYRDAYKTRVGLRSDAVYNRASSLAKRPEIRERIDQLLNDAETLAINDYAQLRRFVIERLQVEALQAKTDAVRLKALELLGKIDKIRLFAEAPKEDEEPLSKKDLGKELHERLTKLLGNKTINLTPEEDTE